MKYEDLQQIDRAVSNKLDHNAFPDYQSMVVFLYKQVLSSTLNATEKESLISITKNTIKKFPLPVFLSGDKYYEFLIQTIQNIGEELSFALWEQLERENFRTRMIPISAEKWKELEQFDVQRIERYGVAYRWWKARLVVKYLLDIPITSEDHTDDVDLFVDRSLDRLEIIKEFSCDNKGVKYIASFSEHSLIQELKETDSPLNQAFVIKDKLILSEACIESTRTGIIYPSRKSTNIYGRYFHETDEWPIFTGKTIRRLIKPLTDGRVKTITLPKHQINLSNLEKNNFETNILAHIRNYIFKPKEKQLEVYHRLAHILKSIGLILETEDIFSYFKNLIENKHPDFSFTNDASPLQQEVNRLMKKLIHLTRDVVAKQQGIYKTPLDDGYDMSEKGMIKLHTNFESPSEKFTEEFHNFQTRFALKIKL